MATKTGAVLAPLDDAVLNLKEMREAYRSQLIKILTDGGEQQALVLDSSVAGPLGVVAEVALLKKHNVKQIHLLQPELETELGNITYLARSNDDAVEKIISQILKHKGDPKTANKKYQVYFIPRITMMCESALEESGAMDAIGKVGEFNMDLIPFDEDVLSLELPDAFKECFLDKDPTALHSVASSLMKMQGLFGVIPNIKCKGDNACIVLAMMKRMKRELESQNALPVGTTEIDTLILLDRNVDMVTPFLTQVTYEGLIDELIGVKNSYIDVDAEIVGDKGTGKRKLALNSTPFFKEIRDFHFKILGPHLNRKAQIIQHTYDKRHENMSTKEMHSFMQQFKQAHNEHSALTTHTNVAQSLHSTFVSKPFNELLEMQKSMLDCENNSDVEDYLDNKIAKMDPYAEVLRTLCLYSVCNGGVRAKKFDMFKRDLIQTYGFETLITLDNLENLGLFTKQAFKLRPWWPIVRRALKLIVDDPNDISYTYGGYAPLSARLVELASAYGWDKIEKQVLDYLPGRYLEEKQQQSDSNGFGAAPPEDGRKPLTVVFFIGGVTFAEISALRHLGQKENRDYVVCTTKLINGSTLMQTLVEKIDNKLMKSSVLQR